MPEPRYGECVHGNTLANCELCHLAPAVEIPHPATKTVMVLDELAAEIRSINRANGWNVTTAGDWNGNPYKVPAVLALIHSEVSEALEAYRKNDHENFMEEMADVLIRVLDCVGGFQSGFDAVVEAKLEKNRHRGYRHGGKRV